MVTIVGMMVSYFVSSIPSNDIETICVAIIQKYEPFRAVLVHIFCYFITNQKAVKNDNYSRKDIRMSCSE